MNKYQEALDRLVHYLVPFHATSTKENAKMINDCLNTFKELVDKETPKELISVYDDTVYSSNQTTLFKIYKCPVCGNKNIIPDNKYCRECGNRVFRKRKWSEE